MKFKLLVVAFLLTPLLWSQNEEITSLNNEIKLLKSQNNRLTNRLDAFENSNFELKNKLTESEKKVQSEIERSQELQAQNERAMNIALDGFAKKFEEQNETVKGVKDELSKKLNNQLIMFALAFVVLVVIFIVVNKNSVKKALNQNQSNWIDFQDHLLKK